MSKISIRKRRKKNSLHGWLLWFSLTASFALMGLSLAAFQSDLSIMGTINVGTVDLSYKHCQAEIERKGQEGRGDANISCDGGNLQATISDASPGFKAKYSYWIKNNGSLPVRRDQIDIDRSNLHDRIELKHNNPPDLIPAGEERQGWFVLHVKGQADEGDYSFNMDLHYILQNLAD